MEDKRSFSLRQKKPSRRPTISAPKQLSNQSATTASKNQGPPRVNGLSEKPQNVKEERPGRPGGNTADLVKRRYSTRFAQLPDFNNADIPPVPNGHLPNQSSKLNYPVPNQAQNPDIDIAALKNADLDPEKYSSAVLADASDQQLRDFQNDLRKLKNRASTNLQRSVVENRTQFIKISKEAEKLNEEMRTLRGLMSELNTSVNNLSSDTSMPDPRAAFDDVATRARKQANRSSVANLEVMRNVELQTLWKNVSGSQKFLPAIPGRHIVLEQSNWVELDAATWRARRQAHIILLNDHLMIATKKKKRVDPGSMINGDTEQKASTVLVVEKCWPLQDIDLLDLASMANARDRHEIAHAISIRSGHESFTYRSDRSTSADKNNLLLSFRKTSKELRQVGRADTESSTKSKEAMKYHATRDPTLSQKTELLRSLSNSKDRAEILIDVDGKQQNVRWVESQIDEVDIDIALQRFEDAVRLIEKLRKLAKGLKGKSIAQELITIKLDGRANKLADLVVLRLIETHSFSRATQTSVAWLVRLGFDDRARESFLKARSDIITKRARQCIFEGDLRDYIFQVSFVYFTVMKNTVSIYQQCFPPPMMSACVNWAKGQLDGFNVILARQLSSIQRGSQTWNECMDQAKEHAALVDEVGLDFKELVRVKSDEDEGVSDRGLLPH
ncbi:MAG: hypothetical protein Q9218_007645 [Villophora microphyllina]